MQHLVVTCVSELRVTTEMKKIDFDKFSMTRLSFTSDFVTPLTHLAAMHCENHDLLVINWSSLYALFSHYYEPCHFTRTKRSRDTSTNHPFDTCWFELPVEPNVAKCLLLSFIILSETSNSAKFPRFYVDTKSSREAWELRGATGSESSNITVAQLDWGPSFGNVQYQLRE